MLRRSAALLLLLCASAAPVGAQLRPLDPLEARVWEGEVVVAGAGLAVYHGQRASLAGTEGRLIEGGLLTLVWRTGRVAIEAGGTVQRFFRDELRFAEPYGGATDEGPRRRDSGDWRIATVVRLTPERGPAHALLRFGTRLPTTDNLTGLERDQTDFFATVGGMLNRGAVLATLEAGVGINGTREPHFEQSDVFVYILRAEYRGLPITPVLTFTGHFDGLEGRNVRGNEDLGEVRFGVRAGRRYWAHAEVVKGYTTFSPTGGFSLAAGITR